MHLEEVVGEVRIARRLDVSGASDPVPSLIRNQKFRYVDTFHIMKSKHTVKTGFEAAS